MDHSIPSVTTIIKPQKEEEVLITTKNTTGTITESSPISISIIAIPSADERVVAVDEIPFHVIHQGGSYDEIAFTVKPLSDDPCVKVEPINLVINTRDNTIKTEEASADLLTIAQDGKCLNVTVTNPIIRASRSLSGIFSKEKKKGKWKERIKTSIIVVFLAVLLCMTGKPTESCKCTTVPPDTPPSDAPVVSTSIIPQPHNFFLPQLNPLGVTGPLTLANAQILNTMENYVSDILNASAMMTVDAARSAFKMGSVVENVRNDAIIKNLHHDISVLHKDVLFAEIESDNLRKDADYLRMDLEKSSNEMSSLIEKISNFEEKISELGENLLFTEKQLSQERNLVDRRDSAIANLNSVVQQKNETISDLQHKVEETIQIVSDLIATKTQLEAKVIELDAQNITGENALESLKLEIKDMQNVIDDLKVDIDRGVSFHKSEVVRLETEFLQEEQATYQRGYTEALQVGQNERKQLIEDHKTAMKQLEDGQTVIAHNEYVRGRKEISDAMTGTIATLQQKLTLARRNMDHFLEWSAPHIRVIRHPNNRYEVNYNVEHISRVSPLLKDYIGDVSEQFEAELNGKYTGLNLHPIIDLKVTQRILTSNGYAGKLRDFVFGPKTREAGRFEMVLIGTSGQGDAPVQYYDYLPLNVNDLGPYREAIERANAITVTTVTTTMTNVKTETMEAVPATIIQEKVVTLSPQVATTVVTEYVQPGTTTVTSVPSPFTETVTKSAIVTETPTVVTVTATETTTEVSTATPTPTTVTIVKDPETNTITMERVKTETRTETVTETQTVPTTTTEYSTVTPTRLQPPWSQKQQVQHQYHRVQ